MTPSILNFPIFFLAFKNTLASDYFIFILFLILLDFLTGFLKSLIKKNTNSSIGLKGVSKHFLILLITISIIFISFYSVNYYVSFGLSTFLLFIILQYLTSIVENMIEIGIPIPETFKKFLQQENEKHK